MENKRTKQGKAPRQGPPLVKFTHNDYQDLQNEWSVNARTVDYSNLRLFLVTALILIMLGGGSAMYIWDRILSQTFPDVYIQKITQLNELDDIDSLPNFASYTNGADIIPSSTSVTTHAFTSRNSAYELLKDQMAYGKCWGFEGDKGFVTIQLGDLITSPYFTLGHLNRQNIASAPRKLEVYGIGPYESFLLGRFETNLYGKETNRQWQFTWQCQYNCDRSIRQVVLQILENYGGDSTCVYQFKVHGNMVNIPQPQQQNELVV